MQMSNEDFQCFVDNYSADDKVWLDVEWNGKFGSNFHDENYCFRLQIADLVCGQLDQVDLSLIHDLFISLGKVAQLNFQVYSKYHLLSQELLERGGHIYLFDYVCVAHISFDTFLSTANIKLSKERKHELLAYFDYLRKEETSVENQKLLADHIRDRFLE